MSLVVRDLVVDRGRRRVLHGVDLEVSRGEVVGVVGPNGCGKSTLLGAVCGTVRITSGEVEVDGLDVRRAGARRRARVLGYVPQAEPVPAGALTVVESVELGVDSATGPARAREAAVAVVHRLGLGDLALRRTAELSGGQRQRVSIARALVGGARHLLLDEPVSSLDLRRQVDTMALLRQESRDRGVLVVLHDLDLALEYCHRVVVVEQGRVLADGGADEVIDRDVLTRLYGDVAHLRRVDGRIRVLLGPEPPAGTTDPDTTDIEEGFS